MATAASPPIASPVPPTSPTKASMANFSFPKSSSPDKYTHSPSPARPEVVKPNAHPYQIKTTSTALLTRSNSATSNTSYSGQHRYIPRHRHNSSVGPVAGSDSEEPRPLPAPPSPEKGLAGDPGNENPHMGPPPAHQPRRLKLKKSETHSSSPSPAPVSALDGKQMSTPPLSSEDLPPNPKQWTPAQLSVYLTTALKVQNERVASDIAAFVREKKINGRVFLRMNDDEIQSYDLSPPWRNALLSASRNLRQNVLKGRIWGVDSDSSSDPDNPSTSRFGTASPSRFMSPSPKSGTPEKGQDDETTPSSRRSVFLSGHKLPVYSSAESSSSVEDLSFPPLNTGSISAGGSNKFKSISRGSIRSKRTSRLLQTSGFFDGPASDKPDDDAGSGLPPASSPSMFMSSPGGRYKNGRVKGMAKGFERIASEDENQAESAEERDPITNEVVKSPTHSRLLSAESQSRILRDMEKLKQRGQVRKERERSDSQSSMSSQGSPTRSSVFLPSPSKIGITTDLPMSSPSILVSESPIESPGSYFSNTIIPSRHIPPGPPGLSPLPTPPPSAIEAEGELTVEELLALQGGSVRRKAKKEKPRGGVHAWEDGEDGEGFVTVKRVSTSSGSPSAHPPLSASSPAAAEARRVITPITVSHRITPISVPMELPQPLKVTSELATADITEHTTGGLVHPKPVPEWNRWSKMIRTTMTEKRLLGPYRHHPESISSSMIVEPVTPVTTEAIAPAVEEPVLVQLEQPVPQQPIAPAQNSEDDEAEELRRLVEDLRRTKALVAALKLRVDEVEKNVEVLKEEVEEQEIRRHQAEADVQSKRSKYSKWKRPKQSRKKN
ncbi:hypothetical protein VNI00_010094 [Paramarasmius palmivorus]|uniref:Uncharacterized protein n=1 Tax=Paramarasmius palmivorus TaxID=297713 RepID=A0AAW0CMG3_9AGAR